MLQVAFMSRGDAGNCWESLKRKENFRDMPRQETGCGTTDKSLKEVATPAEVADLKLINNLHLQTHLTALAAAKGFPLGLTNLGSRRPPLRLAGE